MDDGEALTCVPNAAIVSPEMGNPGAGTDTDGMAELSAAVECSCCCQTCCSSSRTRSTHEQQAIRDPTSKTRLHS